jgi:hypothetical protein
MWRSTVPGGKCSPDHKDDSRPDAEGLRLDSEAVKYGFCEKSRTSNNDERYRDAKSHRRIR